MFTRKGTGSAFDSISLVELKVTQHPVDGHPRMEAKLCYVNAKSGHTFGYINFKHAPYEGLDLLTKETQDAWAKFVECVENDQGKFLFGEGNNTKLNMFGQDNTQAESEQGMPEGLGLGGG